MATRNGKQPPGTIPDKLQPHDVEAEEAVLGSLLIDADAVIRIAPVLDSADFFIDRHGWLYDAICSLSAKNTPADIVTLTDEMERRGQLEDIGGPATITDLMSRVPSSIFADHYAAIVAEKAARRRLINGAGDIARLAFDAEAKIEEVLDRAEEIIFATTAQRERQNGPRAVKHLVNEHVDRVEYMHQHKGQLSGLPTGFSDLDRTLGGLQRSDTIILAGRPGMGKTSLALSIALHNAKRFGKRVGIFSLEMSSQQLTDRLVSAESGIDSQRLRNGQVEESEWGSWIAATNKIADLPLYIDDTPAITPLDLRARARRLQAEYGLDLLILDYLQLMEANRRGENRQQEITYISRSIKALARELNIPVLALSQLSRACESRQDKRPMLSDLRESGSIEQDADIVMFVYRDDVYNPDTDLPNVAEVIIGKHRSGPTGTFNLFFKKHLAQFVPLETRRVEFEPVRNGNGRHT